MATDDDLQKAINEITGGGESAEVAPAPEVDMTGIPEVVAEAPASEVPAASFTIASAGGDTQTPASAPAPAPAAPATFAVPAAVSTGGAVALDTLESIKYSALRDLKPLIDVADLSVEEKFMIYQEMMNMVPPDREVIQPAYELIKQMSDDRLRAESLLFIVRKIDEIRL